MKKNFKQVRYTLDNTIVNKWDVHCDECGKFIKTIQVLPPIKPNKQLDHCPECKEIYDGKIRRV